MNPATASTITPENIVDITIQYVLPQTGLTTDIPSIRVNFGDPVRYQEIGLAEVRHYIKFLQIKAALAFLSVIAEEDEDRKTVIKIGAPIPPEITGIINFQINGVDFDASNNLATLINTSGLPTNHSATYIMSPCAVVFTLPKQATNFAEQYQIGLSADNHVMSAEDNGDGNWLVTLFTYLGAGGNYTINILATEYIKFNSNGFDMIVHTTNFGDSYIKSNSTEYVKKDVGYFLEPGTYANSGGLSITQKEGAVIVDFQYCQPIFNDSNLPLSANVTEIILDRVALKQTNHLANDLVIGNSRPGTKVNGACSLAAGDILQVLPMYKDDITGAITVIVQDVSELPFNLSFLKNGVLVNTIAVNLEAQKLIPTNIDWDELQVGGAAPPVGKSVFLINNTGLAIQVETDTSVYNFAAGVNGNIICTGAGFIKNESGAPYKFTFLQSLPAVVDVDEVPNPDTLADAASHVFNASLANLNYIKVELP